MFSSLCRQCQSAMLRSSPTLSLMRAYATIPSRTQRDRLITAETIHFIDAAGTFTGTGSLSQILSTFDPTQYTLINLTPNKEVPTCRLYSRAEIREMETKAYAKRREKKGTGDPGKVLKECLLNWNCTEHDLQHKLESGRTALRRGNKLDVQIGTKSKRGQKVTTEQVRADLVAKVRRICDDLGREWKASEGNLKFGVTLHYIGTPVKTPAAKEGAPAEAVKA